MAPLTEACYSNGAIPEVCFAIGAPPTEHCLASAALSEVCFPVGAPSAGHVSANGAPILKGSKVDSTEVCAGDSGVISAALNPLKAACGDADGVVSGAAGLWTSAFEWSLDFPLATVWSVTHDFVNISKWLPTYMRESALVAGTPQLPGCVRSVVGYQDDIPPAYDQLLQIDELNHKFKYRILTCHLPLLMGHAPTFHFLSASPTRTILKFSTERPPVPNYNEQSYRSFVYELYNGFVSDLIRTLSTSA